MKYHHNSRSNFKKAYTPMPVMGLSDTLFFMQNSEKMNGELYAFEQEFHKGIAACVGVETAVVYQIIFDQVNQSMYLGVPSVDNHWWADSNEVKRIAPYLNEESIKESLNELVEKGYLIQRNTLFSLGDAENI